MIIGISSKSCETKEQRPHTQSLKTNEICVHISAVENSEMWLVHIYLEGDTKSVLIIRGIYYQGWFTYMRYTQGQNESTYYPGVCTEPGTC